MGTCGSANDGLPTVRDLLSIPSILEAQPVVLVGGDALDNSVRWVHVSGVPQAIKYMRGGEVLLTNCGGWPTAAESLLEIAAHLIGVRATGVIIELNSRFPRVHTAFIDALAVAGIALVQLERRVDSVRVTEHAHRRILSGQSSALEARDQVHQMLIALTLRGVSAEFLISQLARILNTAIVLENPTGEIVALAGMDWSADEVRSFKLAAAEHSHESASEGLVRVPVEARGTRWGTLTALPGPAHPAGRRVVLEQGAIALAFERLSSNDERSWLREAAQLLLIDLLKGRYTNTLAVEQRLTSLGFPLATRNSYGAVLQGSDLPSDEVLWQNASKLKWKVLTATRGGDRIDLLLSLPHSSFLDEESAQVLTSESKLQTYATPLQLVVGPLSSDAQQIVDSLSMAASFAEANRSAPVESGFSLLQLERRPLLNMLAAIRRDSSSQQAAIEILSPVLEHDRKFGSDLVSTLAAVVRNPLSRSKAIAETGLSRTAFYNRLRILEELLNSGQYVLNLDDDEVIIAIHLAIKILPRSLSS